MPFLSLWSRSSLCEAVPLFVKPFLLVAVSIWSRSNVNYEAELLWSCSNLKPCQFEAVPMWSVKPSYFEAVPIYFFEAVSIWIHANVICEAKLLWSCYNLKPFFFEAVHEAVPMWTHCEAVLLWSHFFLKLSSLCEAVPPWCCANVNSLWSRSLNFWSFSSLCEAVLPWSRVISWYLAVLWSRPVFPYRTTEPGGTISDGYTVCRLKYWDLGGGHRACLSRYTVCVWWTVSVVTV